MQLAEKLVWKGLSETVQLTESFFSCIELAYIQTTD
jgi:hypothetical protein